MEIKRYAPGPQRRTLKMNNNNNDYTIFLMIINYWTVVSDNKSNILKYLTVR